MLNINLHISAGRLKFVERIDRFSQRFICYVTEWNLQVAGNTTPMPIISLRENNNFIRENKIVMKFSILKIPKLRNNINLIYIPFHYFQFIINRRGFATIPTKLWRNDKETLLRFSSFVSINNRNRKIIEARYKLFYSIKFLHLSPPWEQEFFFPLAFVFDAEGGDQGGSQVRVEWCANARVGRLRLSIDARRRR